MSLPSAPDLRSRRRGGGRREERERGELREGMAADGLSAGEWRRTGDGDLGERWHRVERDGERARDREELGKIPDRGDVELWTRGGKWEWDW